LVSHQISLQEAVQVDETLVGVGVVAFIVWALAFSALTLRGSRLRDFVPRFARNRYGRVGGADDLSASAETEAPQEEDRAGRMNPPRRWRIAIAMVALLALAWWFRYDVQRCNDYRCTILDRWTGEVFYKRLERR
jgi:hypothetical protein